MSKRSMQGLLTSTLALTLAFVGALPAASMQQEDEKTTTIRIERYGDDDGERHVARHKVIFVNEDGETTELEGEGNHYMWFKGEGHEGEEGLHLRMGMPHHGMRGGMRGGLHGGAFLGVSTTPMTGELRQHFGVF